MKIKDITKPPRDPKDVLVGIKRKPKEEAKQYGETGIAPSDGSSSAAAK